MPVFPKSCPAKPSEFLAGITKLNLSHKRLFYGTEYGRSVALRLLEFCQQLPKILKATISMKSAISKDKLIIKNEKLAGIWCNSHHKDFWNLAHQNRGNNKLSGCNIIDGLTTDEDISLMFSSKMTLLLNSDLDPIC